jgi:N-acyl-D-amino-acid deacylase
MKRFLFLLLAGIASGQNPPATGPPSQLVQNAVIYDGSGAPPTHGDVRIATGKIIAVGRHLKPQPSEIVHDAHGLALAPGFIDMHSHADRGLLEDPTAASMVRQGITLSVVGQDGGSNYPLADWFAKLEKSPATLNIASMAGFATLRRQTMGKDLFREATAQEIEGMKQLLTQEMQAGAFGISTGLEYADQHSASTAEVVEVSKAAAQAGGFYISHVRDEANDTFKSFEEITEIGRRAHLPVEITHIKLGAVSVWHQAAKRMPQVFAAARRQHIDLRADVYPYTYWHSTWRVIVLDRDYYNPEKVAKAIADNGGPERLRMGDYGPNPAMNGKTLDEIARLWSVTPVEAYIRIIRETDAGDAGKRKHEDLIGNSMSEDDLRWFIADSRIMFCTDGGLRDLHPRGAGAYPRILGRYVRDERLLPLTVAIHKMTGRPASKLGLKDRGHIATGYAADLVLFDPARVIDRATVEDPLAAPEGIVGVMVNGQWVIDDGKITGARPGKVLRRPNTN